MKPMSLTAYGQRRGVSAVAVSKAIKTGRLAASVVRDEHGAPKIADPDLADQEWEANSRQAAPAPLANVPDLAESNAMLMAAKARRECALADLAELELGERRGELVSTEDARSEVRDRYAIVRTRMLGVPSRVAQLRPDLAAEVVPVLEKLIREALEELADEDSKELAHDLAE